MQRLLKYPLLFKEMHKYTDDTSSDKSAIATARTTLNAVCSAINSRRADHNSLAQIQSSLKEYSGRPLKEYGRLLKDGHVKVRVSLSHSRA